MHMTQTHAATPGALPAGPHFQPFTSDENGDLRSTDHIDALFAEMGVEQEHNGPLATMIEQARQNTAGLLATKLPISKAKDLGEIIRTGTEAYQPNPDTFVDKNVPTGSTRLDIEHLPKR